MYKIIFLEHLLYKAAVHASNIPIFCASFIYYDKLISTQLNSACIPFRLKLLIRKQSDKHFVLKLACQRASSGSPLLSFFHAILERALALLASVGSFLLDIISVFICWCLDT